MFMNRPLSYILYIFLIICIASPSANADNVTQAQKEEIKTIKKTLGAKRVDPLNSNLYRFLTKDGRWGVADRYSKILIAPEYNEVVYFPEFDGNSVEIKCDDPKNKKSTRKISVPTEPTREAIWGFSSEKGAVVFDTSGRQITTFPNKSASYFGNYLFLTSHDFTNVYNCPASDDGYDTPNVYLISWYEGNGNVHGSLVRSDGTVVIPVADRAQFYADNPYLIYKIVSDKKVELYGMKVVDNHHYDRAPERLNMMGFNNKWVGISGNNKFIDEIPPTFYSVECRNGVWMVSDKPSDRSAYTVYEPDKTKAAIIRDPGEAFYTRGQSDDVIAYYSGEGLDAPWASFYSAEALLDKRHPSQFRFELAVESMERGSGLPKNEQGIISDVNVIREMINMAITLYDKYLNFGETEFRQEAISGKEMAIQYLKNLNEYIARYNNVRSHAAMVSSQEEARQAALMTYFLNSFSNAIKSASSSAGTKSQTASFSESTAVPASQGGSQSATDNSGRKAFLKGQIADWRNKLKKAERSYEKMMGSGEDTWQKKKVLESQQHTIDECANMIRQYESELNSLK